MQGTLARAFAAVKRLPVSQRGVGRSCLQLCMEVAVNGMGDEQKGLFLAIVGRNVAHDVIQANLAWIDPSDQNDQSDGGTGSPPRPDRASPPRPRATASPPRHTHTKHQRSGSRGLPSESGSPPEHILHVTTSLDQADSSPAGHHQPARWRSRKSPSPVYKSPSPRPVSREPSPAVASPAQGSKGRSAPRGLGPRSFSFGDHAIERSTAVRRTPPRRQPPARPTRTPPTRLHPSPSRYPRLHHSPGPRVPAAVLARAQQHLNERSPVPQPAPASIRYSSPSPQASYRYGTPSPGPKPVPHTPPIQPEPPIYWDAR